jgi:hypothetical protein
MSKARPEVVECFLRAGAEFDSWKYIWRVSGLAFCCSANGLQSGQLQY